jgi:protocatechuate 3,4-dioxygenase beta subunit
MNHSPPDRPAPSRWNPSTYEGRVLRRPDEDEFDQGLQFDLSTMLTRRHMLSMLGIGAGVLTVAVGADRTGRAGASGADGTPAEIPDETGGPFPADGSNGPDILEHSGVVRSDITSSIGGASGVADGVPQTFSFTVLDMANRNRPFAGAAVYAWHCDAEGRYSMYSRGAEDENYLRGVQVADADGVVTFTSIFPGCYPGRWPHIHFEVYPDVESIVDHESWIATSQAAFPEDACADVYDNVDLYAASIEAFAEVSIERDGIFDPATIDQQLLIMSGDRNEGYVGTLVVPVDRTTGPSAPMGRG